MEEEVYGVIRLSVVPVRASASDASEMISQLLFGEHYQVLEFSENKKWLKVVNQYDGYTGWIDQKQHTSISREFYDQITNSDYRISIDVLSELTFQGQMHRVSFGSILPLLSNPLFSQEEQIGFNGQAKPIYTQLSRTDIIDQAKKLLNVPYLWGGRSSGGIDCSGLTQLAYRVGGYYLPRDSSQQILTGDDIDLQEILAGDLAFFTNQEGKMNHVGLVLNAGQVIHASGRVRIDQLDAKGIYNIEQNEYTHHLFKIKRYLPIDQ